MSHHLSAVARTCLMFLPLLGACDYELKIVRKASTTDPVEEAVTPPPTTPAPPPMNEPVVEVAREPQPGVAVPDGVEPPEADVIAEPQPVPLEIVRAPVDVYTGVHKLGVNRVTDMARVGTATFTRKDGPLQLHGRVQRGKHWLTLSGTVEVVSAKKFHLDGFIQGVPDMAWNGEAPRERRTMGRFTFEVRKNRPYWRLYGVNGRDCVCDNNCGNDFCYIDIEHQPTP